MRNHPSFNSDLLTASPEEAVSAFISAGDLSVDEEGRVWRHRRKVGGVNPRMVDIPVVRAENILPSGRHQIQIYVLGTRILCLAARLVWYCHFGEIGKEYHIHHLDENVANNNIENLERKLAVAHISEHSIGRTAWNKGTEYGKTDAFKKAIEVRQRNHEAKCVEARALLNWGFTISEIAEHQNICERQVYIRLQYLRKRYPEEYGE